MIALPAILIAYIAIVAAFLVYSFAAFYHLRRYGYPGDLTNLAIFVYSLLSVLVIALTLSMLLIRGIGN